MGGGHGWGACECGETEWHSDTMLSGRGNGDNDDAVATVELFALFAVRVLPHVEVTG